MATTYTAVTMPGVPSRLRSDAWLAMPFTGGNAVSGPCTQKNGHSGATAMKAITTTRRLTEPPI